MRTDKILSLRRSGASRCSRLAQRARGAALLLSVYLFTAVLFAMVIGVTSTTTFQTKSRARYERYKDEFAAAEQALAQTYAHAQFLIRYVSKPYIASAIEASPQPVVSGFDLVDFVISPVTSTASTFDYSVAIQVRRAAEQAGFSHLKHPGVRITQDFTVTYTALNEFAIFYDPIMEIAPGPAMIVNGKVHCNGDMYVQSNNRLTFTDMVTAAGNIYHGRHPDSGKSDSNGDVFFTAPDGSGLENMERSSGDQDGSGWLDSRDSDWADMRTDAQGGTGAYATWGDYVQDAAHEVETLDLPIPTTSDPHDIIERTDASDPTSLSEEKFENKAGFKILADSDGNMTGTRILRDAEGNVTGQESVPLEYYLDAAGDAVPWESGDEIPAGATIKSVVSSSVFYDAREGEEVASIDVNIENMLEYTDVVPANGILFVSNEDQGGSPGVVRLQNGSELPDPTGADGFSIATDDPIYIQGDYNHDSGDPDQQTVALVAGDAVYVLSNNWQDQEQSGYGMRSATETTMNVVLINGIVPSANGNYSGGVENYFRFLENWSGRDFIYSGSIIELWESEAALGEWSYGSPVYQAPGRVWSWDPVLANVAPPGMPHVVAITPTSWHVSASEDY